MKTSPEKTSIVVVTMNRLHLLQPCIDSVLAHTDGDFELIVWDNASTDGAADYLDSLDDPRVRVIHSDTNIGVNAYAEAFKHATGDWYVELDDDVIEVPPGWNTTMRNAFDAIPKLGYLGANVLDDGHSTACELILHTYAYDRATYGDGKFTLMRGPTGGWCAMTPKSIYDEVGGFPQRPDLMFFHEDGLYVDAMERAGYDYGLLEEVRVFHASGPYYSTDQSRDATKAKYYAWRTRVRRHRKLKTWAKNVLKRVAPGLLFRVSKEYQEEVAEERAGKRIVTDNERPESHGGD